MYPCIFVLLLIMRLLLVAVRRQCLSSEAHQIPFCNVPLALVEYSHVVPGSELYRLAMYSTFARILQCAEESERLSTASRTEAGHVILHTRHRRLGAPVCTHEGETEAADGVGDHLSGHTSLVAGVAGDGAAMSVLDIRRREGRPHDARPDAEFVRSSGSVGGRSGGTYWSTTFSK